MITPAQISLVHVAKNRLQLDDDSYRALLKAEAGVESARDLDAKGFDRLMRRFEHLGFTSLAHEKRRQANKRRGTITHEQQSKIAALYEELVHASAAAGHPGFASTAARTAFNRRQCGKAFPQTIGDAMKVIEGQKKMLGRFTTAQNLGQSLS